MAHSGSCYVLNIGLGGVGLGVVQGGWVGIFSWAVGGLGAAGRRPGVGVGRGLGCFRPQIVLLRLRRPNYMIWH
jgi:hypothetical protein